MKRSLDMGAYAWRRGVASSLIFLSVALAMLNPTESSGQGPPASGPRSGAKAAELVGLTVPPFPGGMYQGGGACIGDKPDLPCERSVGVLINSAGNKVGIYAASDAGRDDKGRARWLISDVVPYPQVHRGYDVVWADCRSAGITDKSIVALVRTSKTEEWLQASDWAYRVDGSREFIKLDPGRVDCVNTALGAD
jgi:hypothetical protein